MFEIITNTKHEGKETLAKKKDDIKEIYEKNIFKDKEHLVNFMGLIYGYLFLLILSILILFVSMIYKKEIKIYYENNFLINFLAIFFHVITLLTLILKKEITGNCNFKLIVIFTFLVSTIYSYGLLHRSISLNLLIILFGSYSLLILINFFYAMYNTKKYNLFKIFIINLVFQTIIFLLSILLYSKDFLKILIIYSVMIFYGYYINTCFIDLLNNKKENLNIEKNDSYIFGYIVLYSIFGIFKMLKEFILYKFCLIPKYTSSFFGFFYKFFSALKCDLFKFLFKLLCCF